MIMSEINNGTDAIREALRQRGFKINTANLARDLGLSSDTLDGFIQGRTKLSPESLQALTLHLFHGHAEYVPAIDRLCSINRNEAQPLGIRPEPYGGGSNIPPYAGPPRPVKPRPVLPPRLRPGWVE
jgi:hypothetical protein